MLVPDRWANVLVGHHLDPLAATDEPVLTDASRLVAVCPTCHTLLHLDSSRLMTPGQLRAQLARGRVTGPTRSG
jgi:predicted HNH restriction endonuclease